MSMGTFTSPIYFGGIDINSITGWITTGTDTFRYPSRQVNTFNLAQSDNSVTTSAYFAGRKINIRGMIRVSGRENLDDSISELRRILEPINQTLQLSVSGNERKFNDVTVSNVSISDVGGGMAKIEIELTASDPFNYALTTTQALNVSNLTTTPMGYSVTFGGTTSQLPIITCTIDSITAGTVAGMTFSDGTNSISIDRTWAALDILVVDCQNQTVQVNGDDVNFTGNFLEFNQGITYLSYSDEFTARQVDINVIYTKRYS